MINNPDDRLPVPVAVAKNPALYAILGLLIPGLPSLLIRTDKVVGGIQLGLWILSWGLAFFIIGFFVWPAVAVWSAITGYQDSQAWNRTNGAASLARPHLEYRKPS
jgi:hypothetical protein